jgi:peptide/nickel transport system substrate-binding protein
MQQEAPETVGGSRRRFARIGAAVAVVAALAAPASFAAQSATKQTTDWAKGPVTFVFASAIEPSHIDPGTAVDLDSFSATRNLYDSLVMETPSLKLAPGLATKWTAKGKTWTFTLRQGVKFTDGSSLTAAGVKLSLERSMALKQGSAYLLASIKKIAAPNPRTLVVTTAQPDPFLPTHVTKIGIVSAEGIKKNKTASDPWATKYFDSNSDGTGPYVLDKWQKGVQITLKKNTSWWKGWQAGSIDVAINKFVGDTAARVQMFQRGDVDFAELWPPSDAVRVGKQKGFKLLTVDTFELDPVFYLNTKKPPFNNKLVRQAAQYAFDYKAMLGFYKGYGTTPTGPIPADYVAGAKFPAYKQDLAKAKALIQQSGVDVAQYPIKFLLPAGLQSFSVGATILQQSLQQVGFKVNIVQMQFPQIFQAFQKVETSAESSAIISSPYTNDPTIFINNFYLPGGTFNFSLYDNPKVTNLVKQARVTLDEGKRNSLLRQAQRIIRDDAPSIWSVRPKTLVVVPDYVKGYAMPRTDYRWPMYFWPLRIEAH